MLMFVTSTKMFGFVNWVGGRDLDPNLGKIVSCRRKIARQGFENLACSQDFGPYLYSIGLSPKPLGQVIGGQNFGPNLGIIATSLGSESLECSQNFGPNLDIKSMSLEPLLQLS